MRDFLTDSDTRIPDVLRLVVPKIGSLWAWEPMRPAAFCIAKVTDVRVNADGEVWIQSESVQSGRRYWNELDRWVQATVLIRTIDGGE